MSGGVSSYPGGCPGEACKVGYVGAALISRGENRDNIDPYRGIAANDDPSSPPFDALAPTRAQAAIISLVAEARRLPPNDVAADRPVARRSRRRAVSGQRHRAGALLNPDCSIEELEFLRARLPAAIHRVRSHG